MGSSGKKRPPTEEKRTSYEEAEARIARAARTNATVLDLSGLGLTVLPESLGRLTALQDLVLSYNQLTALPESLGRLTALQTLEVGSNQLTAVPESLDRLTGLRELDISNNLFTVLPQSVCRLTTLRILDVSENHLTILPEALGRLTALQNLNASSNYLVTLPESIGHLVVLGALDVSHNRLSTLPASIGRLSALTHLFVGGNQLSALPATLGHLSALTELYVNDNEILALPDSIGYLTALTYFDISHNRLEELPEAIGRLTALEVLNLWDNALRVLPESVGRLTALTRFYVFDNRLTALPASMRNLSSCEELYLHGNPGLEIPVEVLGPSSLDLMDATTEKRPARPADILDYYFRTQAAAWPLNEAKLILLGRGEVGKTCVVNRLERDVFEDTDMTRGIQITQWPVQVGDAQVRVHVWDFGGQEIQHATHRFFLTERSLYLVVLNGRAGGEEEDAEYWLKFVQTFGGGSPTLVVLNKRNTLPARLNQRGLQDKYPFIRAFVETDCKHKAKNGISELHRQIISALGAMEHVCTPFPADWFHIKDELATLKKPFISFNDFRATCVRLGEEDPTEQERLAGFLNVLGIALNYRDDERLRDETVLNPRWITDGVYQVLTSPALADRHGVLSASDLAALLDANDYPERMHRFLLQLMRKFELCFPLEGKNDEPCFLVPELLAMEQPALADPFVPAECLGFRYTYTLMPEGLLPRFITRTHAMSAANARWRTGVVLRWEGCRALVKADRHEHEVIVRVVGPKESRRRLMAVIREHFDRIHADLRGFEPAEWVASQAHPDKWLDIRDLEAYERAHETQYKVRVGETLVAVDVTETLDTADVPGARRRDDERRHERRPLKLFLSYSHADDRWRQELSFTLSVLERDDLVRVWSDRAIEAGTLWDDEIKARLGEADIVLFLVSTPLLASKYVREHELPMALAQAAEDTSRVVPVIVSACSWQNVFGRIQAVLGEKPLKGRARDRDRACLEVENELRKVVSSLMAKP